jgi:hypothetical protein
MTETNLHRMLAGEKDPDLDQAVQVALADAEAMRETLEGLVSKEEVFRYNCFKVLHRISKDQPLVMYPEWDYFVELVGSSNSYHRSIALRLLANLTPVDSEGRFERIFDRYFDLLDDESVVTARYLAQDAGRIVRAKPHLRARIVDRLLAVDETHHPQGRKDLIRADVIQSFAEFFEDSDRKERILAFVQEQLECSSPKTRKAAKAFLNKYGK